jgi:hypothetical protein
MRFEMSWKNILRAGLACTAGQPESKFDHQNRPCQTRGVLVLCVLTEVLIGLSPPEYAHEKSKW